MRGAILSSCVLAAALAGCGGTATDRDAEMEELIAVGDAGEVLARVELYMDQGEESAMLYFARGWAELEQNADVPARASFSEAVLSRPDLSPRISEFWRAKAVADFDETWYDRAKLRMREAFRYDETVTLEPIMDPVADLLYRHEKDYARALGVYNRLREKTDANFNKRMEWEFRYGHCLEQLGEIDAALAVYKSYLEKFPENKGMTPFVTWRWMMVHKDQAEEALARKDLNGALAWISEAPIEDWHMDLQQQIRYVHGQIREARAEYEEALAAYEQILVDGDQYGGQVVEDAKNRIDAVHALGVH